MSIQFTVEDGTGLSTATSYVSIVEFVQYWQNLGIDYSDTDDYPTETIEAWLNEATAYADASNCWGGSLYSTSQALEVPRSGWLNDRLVDISESVPDELKNGICELAHARMASIDDIEESDGVSSESLGPHSVTYNGTAQTRETKYPRAERWFRKINTIDTNTVFGWPI